MTGSVAEWLTFGTLYLWAGLWLFNKMDASGKPLDMDNPVERLIPILTMLLWPFVAVVAPFWKGK